MLSLSLRVAKRMLSTAANNTSREALAGTVPLHLSYTLLHSPHPVEAFPSKPVSPLLKSIQVRLLAFKGQANFVWREDLQLSPSSSTEPGGQDTYDATVFVAGRSGTFISGLNSSNLGKLEEILSADGDEDIAGTHTVNPDEVHLYVCTHGSRDCRCGETGTPLAQALRDELQRRRQISHNTLNALAPDTTIYADNIKIGEICHVGGHKYAGNVLVFPHGEWLGYATPDDAPAILDAALSVRHDPPNYKTSAPLISRLWRGRMGIEKEEQKALIEANAG